MIPVLSKPKDEITIADIQDLIDSEVPEGEQIEFKGTLPAKKGAVDPWMSGGNIGDRAKRVILEEAVAFANAHGGALLLGIKESKSKPPVAAEISPIPQCAELAERLKLVFRDCVEPQLPVLDIFAVRTEGEVGVVIIRVGRSRNAPHRVTKTLVFPIRRANRCEKMNTWEIQQMTLNVSSHGLLRMEERQPTEVQQRVKQRLRERSKRFLKEFKRLKTPEDAYGFRLTAVPVGDEIQIDRVFSQGKLTEEFNKPWHKVYEHKSNGRRELARDLDAQLSFWQPMPRAARGEHFRYVPDNPLRYNIYGELFCDGLIELGVVSSYQPIDVEDCLLFYSDLHVAMFANLAVWVDRVRRQVNAPTAEYALEVEIYAEGGCKSAMYDQMKRALEALQLDSTGFPIYPLDDSDKIPGLLALFHRDFWHSLGKGVGPREPAFRIEGWPA